MFSFLFFLPTSFYPLPALYLTTFFSQPFDISSHPPTPPLVTCCYALIRTTAAHNFLPCKLTGRHLCEYTIKQALVCADLVLSVCLILRTTKKNHRVSCKITKQKQKRSYTILVLERYEGVFFSQYLVFRSTHFSDILSFNIFF